MTTTLAADAKAAKKTGNNTNMSEEQITEMFNHLDIDLSLSRAIHGVDTKISLIDKYTRWVAVNKAWTTYTNETQAKSWPFRTFSKNDLTDHFISKSTFHNVSKVFTAVTRNPAYSDMVDWLQSKGIAKSAIEVWGIEQHSYNEDDLENWMAKGGSLVKKKKKSQK